MPQEILKLIKKTFKNKISLEKYRFLEIYPRGKNVHFLRENLLGFEYPILDLFITTDMFKLSRTYL